MAAVKSAVVFFGDNFSARVVLEEEDGEEEGRSPLHASTSSSSRRSPDTTSLEPLHFSLDDFCALLRRREVHETFMRSVKACDRAACDAAIRRARDGAEQSREAEYEDDMSHDLVSALSGASADVQPSSLSVKITDIAAPPDVILERVKPDNHFGRLLTAFLVMRSWERELKLFATEPIFLAPATTNARLDLNPYIPPASKHDEAFATLFEIPGRGSARQCVDACVSMRKALTLLRAEVWQEKTRFMAWYCDGEGYIMLERLFKKAGNTDHAAAEEANDWAEVALEQLEAEWTRFGVVPFRDDLSFTAPRGARWLVFFSWGAKFHKRAVKYLEETHAPKVPVLRGLTRLRESRIKGCAEHSRTQEFARHFDRGVADSFLPHTDTDKTPCNFALLHLRKVWSAVCADAAQSDDVFNRMNQVFVERAGFAGHTRRHLMAVAQRLDDAADDSGGYTAHNVARLLVKQLWRAPRDGPIVGEGMQINSHREEEHGEVRPNVFFCSSKSLIRRYKGDMSLLSQLPTTAEGVDIPTYDRERYTRLYHGTSAALATRILEENVDSSWLEAANDFGRAFYTTECFPYAVESAHAVSGDDDMAVLIFDVRNTALPVGGKFLDMRPQARQDDWSLLIRHCRKGGLSRAHPILGKKYRAAHVICGPVSANASAVESERQQARPLALGDEVITQHAFRQKGDYQDLYDDFGAVTRILCGERDAGQVTVLRIAAASNW